MVTGSPSKTLWFPVYAVSPSPHAMQGEVNDYKVNVLVPAKDSLVPVCTVSRSPYAMQGEFHSYKVSVLVSRCGICCRSCN